MSDIVAELDRWMDNCNPSEHRILKRARDEIAATNEAIGRATKEAYALGRDEALEQAAMRCEGSTEGGSIFAAERVAAAIRALKNKQ